MTDTIHNTDQLFAQARAKIGDFVFDDAVADVFTDMLNRSIPGYQTVLSMTGLLAERHVTDHSLVYDLGTSLGAVAMNLAQHITAQHVSIMAVDNSAAMLQRAQNNFKQIHSHLRPTPLLANIETLPFEPNRASMIVLNYTLQFIAPEHRDTLIQRLHDALMPGGILVLSEKICFHNAQQDRLQRDCYHDFKRANGYSDLEISQKRQALENVLIPDTRETHLNRFHTAGFDIVDSWFQCFNFMSFTAIKADD